MSLVPAAQHTQSPRCLACHLSESFEIDDVPEEYGWLNGLCPACAAEEEEAQEMKEAAITSWLQTRLKEIGAWVYKVHGTPMSRGGVPDLLFCYYGVFYAVEMKTETGELAPRQRVELERIRAAKGRALVVRGKKEAERLADRLEEFGMLTDGEAQSFK